MKQKTAPTVFIHDNRMLAERAFYCLKTVGAVPLPVSYTHLDADGLGGIHRGTAADCDDVVSAGSLERYNAVLYVFDGRVCFDIGVDFISKTFAV